MNDLTGNAPSAKFYEEPPLWPPLVGVAWLTLPAAVAVYFRTSDFGILLQYMWAWSIFVPALVLGVGALVIRFRSRHAGPAGLRRRLWYWTGAIYAVAAIPIFAILL